MLQTLSLGKFIILIVPLNVLQTSSSKSRKVQRVLAFTKMGGGNDKADDRVQWVKENGPSIADFGAMVLLKATSNNSINGNNDYCVGSNNSIPSLLGLGLDRQGTCSHSNLSSVCAHLLCVYSVHPHLFNVKREGGELVRIQFFSTSEVTTPVGCPIEAYPHKCLGD